MHRNAIRRLSLRVAHNAQVIAGMQETFATNNRALYTPRTRLAYFQLERYIKHPRAPPDLLGHAKRSIN